MSINRKIVAFLLLVGMVGAVIYGSTFEMTGASAEKTGFSLFGKKETIYFWYSDESLTDYINSAAVAFGTKNGARVIPKLTSDSQYLEAINEASLHSDQVPDVYMISNDSLGKAYLAGLASKLIDNQGVGNTAYFPQTALSAATYHDKLIAYPFFYDTSALIYNETYLREWAGQQALKELTGGGENGEEEAPEPAEGAEVDPTLLAQKTEEYMINAIPATVDDILHIGNTFDVPEGVEGIMKWDVSDIFYNYWIVGNYMIVGGESGDVESKININNPETSECLNVYKNLNQFFFIESDTVTYESVVQDFMQGKTVFTIATTDVVQQLEDAKRNGSMTYDYGIAVMPKVSTVLESRSLSVTTTVAVNGYSKNKELANAFAAFLTTEYTDTLFERTGRVASCLNANKENGPFSIFMQEYEDSIPLAKMIETSNFWIQLEILFSKVWNGADIETLVQQLSEQILSQVE